MTKGSLNRTFKQQILLYVNYTSEKFLGKKEATTKKPKYSRQESMMV